MSKKNDSINTASVREILTQPLDVQSYLPYGHVIGARSDIQHTLANLGTAQRFNHLGPVQNLRLDRANANLCVFRSSPFVGDKFEVKLLERHRFSTQFFVPMNCQRSYLVIVCQGKNTDAQNDEPDLNTLRAFLPQPNQGITYHPGIWHHPMIALDAVTDFACLVFENGTAEDCEVKKVSDTFFVKGVGHLFTQSQD